MERLLLAAALVVVAVAVALLLERRRRDAPTQAGPRTYPVPQQLDRADFPRPDAPWLVAVFTSESCESCDKARQAAAPLDGPHVAVVEVELGAQAELHARYAVGAVPTLVVADAAGVVRASYVGPPDALELWGAVAALRESSSDP